MNGNILKSAGLAVGIAVGLIVAVALILIANNNRKFKSQYDERQLKVRGDAYRYGFYTVLVWEAILFVLSYGEFTYPVPEHVLHFAGIILGILVLSGYSIWKDAYWGLNNNRRRYGVILVAAGLLNALPLIGALRGGDVSYVNLMVCVMLLVVGVELLVKHVLDKRRESAEDGE
jgi:hypothetical protein